jgi:predicted ATPase
MGFEELFVTREQLSKIPPSEDSWARTYLGAKQKAVWKSDQPGGSAKPFIETETRNGVPTIAVRQDGRQGRKATPAHSLGQTVLAGISSADFPHVFAAKEELRSWRFMQLSPEELRKPTAQDAKMSYYLTHQGANLAAALYRIKQADPYSMVEISRQLMRFLPDFIEVDAVNDEANKQFIAVLRHKDGTVFTSRVLSEGTLRVLALVVMQADPEHQGLLCFEEPENGIHPMRIKHMVELLHQLSADFETDADSLRQVIVNTHSPLIVREMAVLNRRSSASVWLSRMSARVAVSESGGRSMRCTEISRADGNMQLSMDGSKLSMADLIQYLSVLNDGEEQEQTSPKIAAIR